MRISVFGLGYVGVVTAACFAKSKHQVLGVDISAGKVAELNSGRSPIVEELINEYVQETVQNGFLTAAVRASDFVYKSDAIIVCVGTPSRSDGSLDTSYLIQVSREIGEILRGSEDIPLIVMRSTMLPGTMRNVIIPELMKSSGNAITEKDILFHPEFLREGSSVKDFFDPPKIVVGESHDSRADTLLRLYDGFSAPVFRVGYEEAEAVKYADNMFHAVKITFANEMGRFCKAHNVDAQRVMELFCSDTKLNISARYLRPGFAFGGSCLPKDLRAFLSRVKRTNLDLPMLSSVLPSNRVQIDTVVEQIVNSGVRKLGLYGLAFKPGTDDLRESPLVVLAETLLGKGFELLIADENVQLGRLHGQNKAYIDSVLPHLANLLVDNRDQLFTQELLIVGHPLEPSELPESLPILNLS